jgi:FAD/FMN-containing dehydrogenase
LGVFVGSEGTFGIATEATVKLAPIPRAVRTLLADFLDVDDASRAVSAIIAAGMLPAALEMMDNAIIRAVEASVFTAGLPIDAQAVLLVELDGIEAGIDDEADKAAAILKEHGARSVKSAVDENQRKRLWAARKGAFGAVGRLLPDVMIQDAVVPRSRLPEVLAETYRISAHYNLQLANVFHAGDGNLHPLICFDLRRGDDLERVRQAGREIMQTCVRAGGSITGEHGVGLDKVSYLPLIFSDDDMSAMLQVRAAFDPSGLCNPGKIIPTPKGCGEARAVATHSVSVPGAVATGSILQDNARDYRQNPVATAPGTDPIRSSNDQTGRQSLLTTRMNEARIARELSQIVSDIGVQRLADFSLDLRSGGLAERITEAAPASDEEASEVIKIAAREGLAMIPAGARSCIDAGNLLAGADLILSTRRMLRIIKHEPADLVATAAAGMTLEHFQSELSKAGQWLPIDGPNDGRATLGGVIASGLSGPAGFGFGQPRSFVIGMRAVLADGRLIKTGGNVVKNVAGYDLCKLFTGSYGTLAFITELTFKLRPLPAELRTIVVSGPLQNLVEIAQVVNKDFFATANELLSPRMREYLKIDGAPNDHAMLLRFSGSPRAVISQTAHALKLAREHVRNHCMTLEEDRDIWSALSAASSGTDANLIWRASLRPTEAVAFLNSLARPAADDTSHVSLRWHAGLGDGRLRAIARTPVYHREAVRELTRLRQEAEGRGGSLILEKAPREIKQEFDSWGSFGSAAAVLKRVKEQLDPENLLSPGRIF